MKSMLLSAASLAVLFAAQSAQAQEAAQVADVIVVGQKAPRTLQDTQASVGLVTAADIERLDLQSFRDAFRVMGNVMDGAWADSGFVIRGVNSEGLTPGGAPLASLYIDGAAQPTQAARRGGRGLWDVQQVEVYRGPQSTLSGRASLAGAIYIETRDPTFERDARARFTLGENATREAAVAVGGGLTDKIAVRLAAEYQSSDSEISYPNFAPFNRYDDLIQDEYWQLRGKVLFTPSDNTRAVLSVARVHDSPGYDDVAGPAFGFAYEDMRGDFNDPYFQEVRFADLTTSSLEVTHALSDVLTLTSVTSFVDSTMERPSVNAGTAGETNVNLGQENEESLTQEVRLNWQTETLQAVAGLYFARDRSNLGNQRTTPFSGGRTDFSTTNQRATNYALFGEATWRGTPHMRLVAGGRLDFVDQHLERASARDYVNPAFTDTSSSGVSDSKRTAFLPKVGVIYDVADRQTLALTVQRGFRVGGAGVSGNGTFYEFAPEYTWTYEVSYRARLGEATTLNANVFYTDWKDQQVELQIVPGDFTSQVTVNAASSRLYGAEVEARTSLTPQIDVFASVGLVNTRFEDFNTVSVGDLSGLEFPEAPKWNAAVGADWRGEGGLFAGFDAKYLGEYLSRDPQNAPVDYLGDYWVANLRFGYRTERWTVQAFADNVFDEEFLTYRDLVDFGGPAPNDCCASVGRGRVAGVTLTVDY